MFQTKATSRRSTKPVEQRGPARGWRLPPAPRWLGPACWVYLTAILTAWLAIGFGEERWWVVTLLLYAPRWPWALPLAVLAPISAVLRPRSLAPLAASAVVVFFPIMDFRVPPPSAWNSPTAGPGLRVMTLNTQGEHLEPDAFRNLVARAWPDVVLLQEWSPGQDPALFFPWEGWEIRESLGLVIACRLPIIHVEALPLEALENQARAARYEVFAHGGSVRIANIHLATPRVGLQALIDDQQDGGEMIREGNLLRRRISDVTSHWVAEEPGPLIVAGDFNLPADASIYRATWSSFADAFESAGLGFGATKFTRWHGVRIDHILVSRDWRVRRCWVGPDVGSDHRPVLTDLELGTDR